jgi:transcriptional regulator with XRE-family HTH domain
MSSIMDTLSFSDWLQRELKQRDWTQADLSRLSGVHRQVISSYVNQKRDKPDETILRMLAGAFKLPPETVYRAAGLLPPVSERSELVERILANLENWPEDDLEKLSVQIAAQAQFLRQRNRPKTGPLKPRGGQP